LVLKKKTLRNFINAGMRLLINSSGRRQIGGNKEIGEYEKEKSDQSNKFFRLTII